MGHNKNKQFHWNKPARLVYMSEVPEPAESSGGFDEYEVQGGDTIYKILKSREPELSRQELMTAADLLEDLNQLESADLIRIGQTLKIPLNLKELVRGFDYSERAEVSDYNLDRATTYVDEMVKKTEEEGHEHVESAERRIPDPVGPESAAIQVSQGSSISDLQEDTIPETDASSRRFGKPEKVNTAKEAYDRLTDQQRKEVLMAMIKDNEMPKLQQRRFRQLELVRKVVEGLKKSVDKGGVNVIQKFAYFRAGDEAMSAYKKRLDRFLEEKVPRLEVLILKNPDTSLRDLMAQIGSAQLLQQMDNFGVEIVDKPITDLEIREESLGMIRLLRQIGDYQSARFMAEALLKDEFSAVLNLSEFKMVSKTVQNGPRSNEAMVINDVYLSSQLRIRGKFSPAKHKEMVDNVLREERITVAEAEKKVNAFIDSLVYQDYLHKQNERVAEFVENRDLWKTWSPSRREIWKEYKDSMGIGALDLADESWDTLVDEIAINAPLIIVSGGVASIARSGLSTGVRALVGAERLAGLAARTRGVSTLAGSASGLAAEGVLFEITNSGLRGDWLFDSPDWAQRIMWSTVALGMFKGAGKFGEGLLAKEGLLKSVSSKIQNPYARKGYEELLVKGHLEVATMILLGAVQNGAYGGTLDEFFDHFGEELFHAYVAVGALKTSGKGVSAGGKMLAEFKQFRKQRAEAKEADVPAGRLSSIREEAGRLEQTADVPREVVKNAKNRLTSRAEVKREFEYGEPVRHVKTDQLLVKEVQGQTGDWIVVEGGANKRYEFNVVGFEKGATPAENVLILRGVSTGIKGAEVRYQGELLGRFDPLSIQGAHFVIEKISIHEKRPPRPGSGQEKQSEQVVPKEVPKQKPEIEAKDIPAEVKKRTDQLEIFVEAEVLKDIPRENIEQAVRDNIVEIEAGRKPTALEGLPETTGPTEVFFLPLFGKGGLGLVREAFYFDQNGNVVRKLVKSSLNEKVLGFVAPKDKAASERILRGEILALDVLNGFGEHPNVMKAHPKGIKDAQGRDYLVIEKVGEIDGHHIHKIENFTPEMAVEMVVQMQRGLNFLHENGVIHRDFKLENVRVDIAKLKAGKPDAVVIIDFGTLSPRSEAANSNPQFRELLNQIVEQTPAGFMPATTGSIFNSTPLSQGFNIRPPARELLGPFQTHDYRSGWDHLGLLVSVERIANRMDNFGVEYSGTPFELMVHRARQGLVAETATKMSQFYDQVGQVEISSGSQ